MSYRRWYLLCVWLSVVLLLAGCGGGSSTSPAESGIKMAISPRSSTVSAGSTQVYTATLTGSTDKAVTWLVNNVAGGNSSLGTISSDGLFTAPATPPDNLSETITAVSHADSTVSASAAVTVTPGGVSISITPTSAKVQAGSTLQFSATVTGTTDETVTWLVNDVQGGNSTVGTISSSGLFTAPANLPDNPFETITAISQADPTKSTSAAVTISSSTISVSVAPKSATVQAGLTEQFTATVTGTTNTAVVWFVNDVQGGNSTYGTISTLGLFTAPATVPANPTVIVKATSYQDPTESGTATVIVTPSGTPGIDYYVSPTGGDSGDGSPAHPWATLNHADAMIGPGAVVHVAPGTYTQAVYLTASGTSSQPIEYISDITWGAKFVIRGSNDSCVYSIGSYIEIIGFDITEDPTRGSCRIGLRTEGEHVTVQKNYVHDLNRDSTISSCASAGGAGMLIDSQLDPSHEYATVDSNVVDDIGGKAPGYAAHTCHYIHNYYLSISHMTATNNLSLRAESWGYSMGGHPPAQPVGYQTLVNNASIADGYGAFYLVSDISGSTEIANNNIVDERWSSGIIGFGGSASLGNGTFSNNLTYMPLGGNAYGMICPTCTVSNPYSGNPLFVKYTGDAAGDYHVQSGSPGIDHGTSAQAPHHDAGGKNRPQGSGWDIGSYEF